MTENRDLGDLEGVWVNDELRQKKKKDKNLKLQ